MHGLGERARPRVPSGAPRARLVETTTGLRPHFFNSARGGASLCARGRARSPGPGAAASLQRRGHRRLAQCCCIHLTLCEEGSACQSRNHCVCESCSGPDKQAPPGLSAYGNGIGRLACERDWRGNPTDEEPQFFKGHGSRVHFLSGPARFDAASAWRGGCRVGGGPNLGAARRARIRLRMRSAGLRCASSIYGLE